VSILSAAITLDMRFSVSSDKPAACSQPAGCLFRGEPWQNGHFGAEMQPVAVAPAQN
jgi:hypothetical protein